MADPNPFEPGFDYSAFEANNPTSPKPGAKLDDDFYNIAQSTEELVEAVKDVRRSDGKLNNKIVTKDSLAPDALALIAAGGSPRGNWTTGTFYNIKDIVSFVGVTYMAVTAHTSGDFAADFIAGKWLVFSAGTANVLSARNFATPEAADAAALTGNSVVLLDADFELSAVTNLAGRWVGAGGVIAPGDHNLTFSGGFDAPPTMRAFDASGSGVVTLSKVGTVQLGWFIDPDATDDTDDMDAAARSAVASSAILTATPMRVFRYNGTWDISNVSFDGGGCRIKQIAATALGTVGEGLVRADNTVGQFARNFILDCDFKSAGLFFSGCTGPKVTNVDVIDAIFQAIGGATCTRPVTSFCTADGVRYAATPANADGFYFFGTTDWKAFYCGAKNVRRIGFVAEANGGVKSYNPELHCCWLDGANNCDDSPAEYNAGFWFENTNGGKVIDFTVKNIFGQAGQTSNRVFGGVLTAVGMDEICEFHCERLKIYGGNGYGIGLVLSGVSGYSKVVVRDTLLHKVGRGIAISGGALSIQIDGIECDDADFSAETDGLIQIATTDAIPHLEFSRISKPTNATYHNDAADINFFNTPASCSYFLHGCPDQITHIMRSAIANVSARNVKLLAGSGSYNSFNVSGGLLEWIDVDTVARGTTIKDPFGTAGAATIRVSGGSFVASAAYPFRGADGSDVDARYSDTTFDGYSLQLFPTGNSLNVFDNVNFKNFGSDGAINTNLNNATRQELIVRNSRFSATDVAHTPIIKTSGGTEPDFIILQGNTYNTTALTDLTPTDASNNVQTL